jgi:hypothetical protein
MNHRYHVIITYVHEVSAESDGRQMFCSHNWECESAIVAIEKSYLAMHFNDDDEIRDVICTQFN